jgi:3-hydroxybutyrate dehydrogenase
MQTAANLRTFMQPTPRPLTDKVAVITGSTSGIGLGIAKVLAEQGAAIVLNGFGERDQIETLRADLAATHDVPVLYDGADLSRREAVSALMRRANWELGKVDILVNNAGIQHVAPVEEFPDDRWEAILSINLSSAFHAIKEALPGMKQRGWGRIINIASAHGLVGSPFKSAYVAAKHGIVGLTKVVALEAAESGVTCNSICPGYVWTPLVEKQIEGQAASHNIPRERVIRDVLLAKQPNKRFSTVDEIGEMVAFLAGPHAASITGAALPVDGGWTAQ